MFRCPYDDCDFEAETQEEVDEHLIAEDDEEYLPRSEQKEKQTDGK